MQVLVVEPDKETVERCFADTDHVNDYFEVFGCLECDLVELQLQQQYEKVVLVELKPVLNHLSDEFGNVPQCHEQLRVVGHLSHDRLEVLLVSFEFGLHFTSELVDVNLLKQK